MDSIDLKFMRRALGLAQKSIGLASPNPPVGCLIVRDGLVVGKGWHEYLARDHAEVRALAIAGDRARGATAYVTLEPCSHEGRTPPCAHALISAGVKRVVAAMIDPNPRVSGKGIRDMRAAGLVVEAGLFPLEAGRLIEPFACHVATGRPLVVCKAGMSLDGRIAAAGGNPGWITSVQGREFGQQLRLQLDSILVGVSTVLADDPQLSYRGRVGKSRPLTVAILDSRLRTPPGASLLRVPPASRVLIYCRPDAPEVRKKELEALGAEVVPVVPGPQGLDLNPILSDLGRRNILGVLVEGGAQVHWSFVSQNLADKFYFIIAPVVLGGAAAVPAVGGKGYDSVTDAPDFRIGRTFRAGPDLVLETYPRCSRSILSPWRSGTNPL